ncbi:MAG: MFS transporter [Armatimonadota bacterium]
MSIPCRDALSVEEQKLAYFRRNVAANLGVEAFWGIGMSLMSWAAILPVFMQRLGASTVLIGALPAVALTGFAVLQIPTAYLVSPLRKKKTVFALLHIPACLVWLAIALLTFQFAAARPRRTLVAFLVLYGLYTLSIGVVIPMWTDFINRLMPSRRRGRAYGLMFMAGNLAGLAGAGLAGHLLGALRFPDNFGACFILTFVSLSKGTACIGANKEPDGTPAPPRASAAEFLMGLLSVIRDNRHFRRFLVARGLLDLAAMAGAFYAVYAVGRFDLGDEAARAFTAAMVVPQIATSLLWGWLGDRAGYKSVALGAAALRLSAAALALIASDAWLFYVVFALMGTTLNGEWVATPNLVVELCPHEDKTTYVSLANTALALPRAAAPLLGGTIAARASYTTVFCAALVLQAIGTAAFAALVREPRRVRGAEPWPQPREL